jgi:hypothetical protein
MLKRRRKRGQGEEKGRRKRGQGEKKKGSGAKLAISVD